MRTGKNKPGYDFSFRELRKQTVGETGKKRRASLQTGCGGSTRNGHGRQDGRVEGAFQMEITRSTELAADFSANTGSDIT